MTELISLAIYAKSEIAPGPGVQIYRWFFCMLQSWQQTVSRGSRGNNRISMLELFPAIILIITGNVRCLDNSMDESGELIRCQSRYSEIMTDS